MAKLVLNGDISHGVIDRHIYGHFSEHLGRCIYGGFWVGEDSDIPNVRGIRTDVVEALKKMQVPVLRWPGGCFADEYHWEDGIGPRENRPKMINTHWGGVTEDNSFGTHEFMDLCEQLGCEPYINGNVGSGTVKEMSQWVEYMNFGGVSPMADLRRKNGREEPWNVKYFAVGNENWGCGGNMRPEYYADEYRRYATYCRSYDRENRLFKVACGANSDDYNWTDVLMKNAGRYMSGLSLHYYTAPTDWKRKGYALDYPVDEWYSCLKNSYRIKELLEKHITIMDKYDPDKRVKLVVDEWGTWYHVEPGTNPGFLYQQSTIRDALVAALTLHLFHEQNDRIGMCCLAQIINVLQSVILTEGDKMVLTPTYHVFEMFKGHQDAERLDLSALDIPMMDNGIPQMTVSASKKDGKILVTAGNLSHNKAASIDIDLRGIKPTKVSGRVLTADMHAYNSFDNPNAVEPKTFEGATLRGHTLRIKMPAASVVALELE